MLDLAQHISAQNVQNIYDSLNRLIEVRYPDKVIRYTYDAAGNRTGATVEILVVAPAVLGLSPRGAVVGGNGLTLKINGSNFTNNSVVQWNGENRPTTFVNANELRINLTAGDIATIGTASVVVVNSTPNAVSNSQMFTVVQTAAFKGRITSGGVGLNNVTVNLSGAESESAVTDGNGNFNFAVLSNGNYTVTPTRQNYAFNPASRNINYSGAAQTNLDFTASLVNYSMSGRVALANGNGLSGVTMTLSGSQAGQTITDNNGNYSFSAAAEGNYVITPSLAGYTFNPVSQSFNNLSANQTTNFTAALNRHTLFDFDGDGKTDFGVFRPSDGVWYLQNSNSGFSAARFGISTDKPTPADYDGDGKTDIAVYREGIWYLYRSQLGFAAIQFGVTDDIPLPADYSGDGKADIAVFRPSGGTWYFLDSANNQFSGVQFGISTDKPVPADYDGDGKTDVAVYRDGVWYILQSNLGFTAVQFGIASDKPVAADFDGDGKADVAVYRGGVWYALGSQIGFTAVSFGVAEDLPVVGDYDGDGKSDIAVWRPSNGDFYVLQSQSGFTALKFGQNGDFPVASAFVP